MIDVEAGYRTISDIETSGRTTVFGDMPILAPHRAHFEPINLVCFMFLFLRLFFRKSELKICCFNFQRITNVKHRKTHLVVKVNTKFWIKRVLKTKKSHFVVKVNTKFWNFGKFRGKWEIYQNIFGLFWVILGGFW